MAARHDDHALEAGQWQEVKPEWATATRQDEGVDEGVLENGHWTETKAAEWKPALASHRRSASRRLRALLEYFSIASWPSAILSKATSRPARLRRTAYLDGLRGFAALLVYWGHHELWAHDEVNPERIIENTYGFEKQFYFITLPGVRTFFSGGHFAVSVFFVLSGYVLSTKPLSLLHEGEYVRFGDNVGSALFRRWLRLYIPVIATTFLYMSSFHALGIRAIPEPEGSYRDEVWKWYTELKNFSFIFDTGSEPWFSYNFHSWSIPVEFKGSIVIYTSLMAFSRATRNARLWCQVGLIVYFLYIADGWFCALFVGGMLLCDLDLLAARDDLPSVFYRLKPYQDTLTTIFFCISIYLGGVPAASLDPATLRVSPGWYYLSFLKPQAVFDYKRFYLFWAAMFLIACLPRMPRLRHFFELRANQYLGRVSYALYLLHGPVLWTLGDRIYAAVGWPRPQHATNCPGWVNRMPLPKVGPLGLEPAFLIPQLVLLPVTLWVAEIGTRLFDERAVQFAHWAHSKTLAGPPTKS